MKKKNPPAIPATRTPRRRAAKALATKESAGVIERLGAALQERRVELGITQKRMADLCGLQLATIGKIESGDLGVKLGTLQTYLTTLNLTLRIANQDEDELL